MKERVEVGGSTERELKERSGTIDALKLFSAQCIVWHHILDYTPMRINLQEMLGAAWDDLFECTRMVVQIFLVIAGFLAAQSVLREKQLNLAELLLKRFLRLAPFYWLVLLAVMALGWSLRFVLVADWMPGPFEWTRFLAHASFTQGIFNEESISAGVWYVAIDFQLYAMLLFCWVCARNAFVPLHMQTSFRWIFTIMCLSSLWYFNRFEAWDNWGIYFVGAYGLGVAVAWTRTHERGVVWYGFLLSMAVTACICFPRGRIALAIVVSMILYVDQANPLAWPLRFRAQMRQWADASYAVFLTHFIWIMLASALWTALDMHGWGVSLAMAILCWLASNVAGRWLHLGVELPLQRCLDRVYLQFITRRDTDRAVLS